jgi:hypothetical protein
MSKIEVDTIAPQSGTEVTIGESGDTVTVPTGVTFDTSNSTVTLPDSSVSLAKLTATGTKDATTFLRGDNSFQEVPAGGITEADQWRLSANFTSTDLTGFLTSNWERNDTSGFTKIGTGLSESSGIFSFATTGIYKLELSMMAYGNGGARSYFGNGIHATTDNSSYSSVCHSYESSYTSGAYGTIYCAFIFDVTDTSTHKFKISFETDSNSTIWESSSTRQSNNLTITRLGDT